MSKTETVGQHYGKRDLDRLGFFDDPIPSPFDLYHGRALVFRQEAGKGRQMHSGPGAALFEKKYPRIFEGEALTEAWRREAQERINRERVKVSGTLKPPSGSKKHSTPGDWYGCFDKPTYFSREMRSPKGKREVEPPNMKTKPNPLGGPGYANICLNPFPSYSPEPYEFAKGKHVPGKKFLTTSAMLDYFPPNPYVDKEIAPTYIPPKEEPSKIRPPGRIYVPFPKKPGGSHDGCFNKFPSYSDDPYIKEKEKPKPVKPLLSASPSVRMKYTNSIIEHVTRRSCNANNYLDYENKVYPSATKSI